MPGLPFGLPGLGLPILPLPKEYGEFALLCPEEERPAELLAVLPFDEPGLIVPSGEPDGVPFVEPVLAAGCGFFTGGTGILYPGVVDGFGFGKLLFGANLGGAVFGFGC